MSSLSLISRKENKRNHTKVIRKESSNADIDVIYTPTKLKITTPKRWRQRFSQTSSKFLLGNPNNVQSASRLKEVNESDASSNSLASDTNTEISPVSHLRPMNAVINVYQDHLENSAEYMSKMTLPLLDVSAKTSRQTSRQP